MSILTQLTLTGQEAEDYLAYRVKLKELGCNSFNELRKKDKLREIDANYADMIKQIHNGIMARIICGRHPQDFIEDTPQNFIEVFKRTLEAFIEDYIENDRNRARFKAQAEILFDYYTK